MATLTITIPADQETRVSDAFAATFGWTSELGVSKAAFVKQQTIAFIKQTVKTYERIQAAEAAQAAVTDPTVT